MLRLEQEQREAAEEAASSLALPATLTLTLALTLTTKCEWLGAIATYPTPVVSSCLHADALALVSSYDHIWIGCMVI